MKKKIIIGTLALTLLAGTATGVYAYNQKVQAAEAAKLEQIRMETDAEKSVDSLYNKSKTMLADDLETKIKNAEGTVKKLEDHTKKDQLLREIEEVKEIAAIQQKVYRTLRDGVLIETVTEKQLASLNQELLGMKNKNNAIYNHLTDYLSKAADQLSTINLATQKVKEAEKALNKDTYDKAIEQVNKVQNDVKKEELKKQLEPINKKIIAMEEANRKKEVEKSVAVASKTEQTTETSNTQTSSSNTKKSSQTKSQTTNKSTSKTTQSSSKSTSSTNKASNSKSSTSKKASSSKSDEPQDPYLTGATDWDEIGERFENHDWKKTGEGEIPGGNTWERFE